MKILFNASNIRYGGGVQVAISLLLEFLYNKDLEVVVFIPTVINRQLSEHLSTKEVYISEFSSNQLIQGRRSRKLIRERCMKGDIDLCFTVFGPTLLRVGVPHVMGFANPWVVLKDISPYYLMSKLARVKAHLVYYIYGKLLIYFDGNVVTETEFIKSGLVKLGLVSENKVTVIGNTYSQSFSTYQNPDEITKKYNLDKKPEYLYLFCIAHDYIHKNLNIIEPVNKILEKKDIKVKFITTIDINSFEKKSFFFKYSCINVGPIDIADCPYLYEQTDALFLPTLLECFTASYPEAMIMRKPILTSNRIFAHEICGNAAIYFDPLSPKDIADKIEFFVKNKKELTEKLVNNATEVLKNIETFSTRADKYINLFKKISSD